MVVGVRHKVSLHIYLFIYLSIYLSINEIPLDAKERASSMSFLVPTIEPLIVIRFNTMSNTEHGNSPKKINTKKI